MQLYYDNTQYKVFHQYFVQSKQQLNHNIHHQNSLNSYTSSAQKSTANNNNFILSYLTQSDQITFYYHYYKIKTITLHSSNYQMYPAPPNSYVSESMQKVQLYLSARNLLDKDFFSKSDPYIKVYFKRGANDKQAYIGKTQVISNNLNPNFNASFKVDYIFEAHQELRFQLFDYDDGKNDDYLGQAVCALGAIAGAKSQTLIIDVVQKNANKKGGKLIIRLETLQQSNINLQMKWKAVSLMNTDSFFDFWDKSDPYLKFIKIRSDNTFIEAQRTEVIPNNLNPSWKPIQISFNKLINMEGNNEGKFKIQCWDWQDDGEHKHQFIGQTYASVAQIKSAQLPVQFILTNRKHKKPGRLVLQQFREIIRPNFMDYLKGGLQLNLSIAIDFTGSNGIPTQPTSLHYMNPYKPNQYQTAISAVCRILLNYDYDKRIPCFGFGGKPHFQYLNNSNVSHCFPLSGDPNNIQAFGLEHLMDLYNKALTSIQLAGPTYFGPILMQAIQQAQISASQGSNVYQILLILTDGEIHDMDKTIDLLVDNCNIPLSIIIVGVGNADFTNMVRLDGDNGLFSSKGRRAARDIVQFVPFRDVGMNPDLLAQQLLAELPGQVTSYMNLINKTPNPPIQINVDNMLQNSNHQNNNIQQAMQEQVTNVFQQANFFAGF